MKKIICILLIISLINCNQEAERLSLVNFKNYKLDKLDIFSFGLGFDEGCNIEVNENGKHVNVKVTFNEVGEFLSPAVEGDYDIRNDTVFLFWKYNSAKGKASNLISYDAHTIVWEYDFIVDTTYTFIFLSDSTSCTIINDNNK